MYTEAHTAIGWFIAQPVKTDRKFRAAVTFAGFAPDLDTVSYLLGPEWFSRYHHVWTHNLATSLLVSGLAAWICRERRRMAFAFTQMAFYAHYFGDYFLSQFPLAYFWPFSEARFGFERALPLWHPLNHALVWLSLIGVLACAAICKRTPVEILSPKLDARLVNLFFRRRTEICDLCGRASNERCARCGRKICGRHGTVSREFDAVCADADGCRAISTSPDD